MFTVHLPTLLLATVVVVTAQVLLVLSMRVGLGPGARGLRTWLIGDVFVLFSEGEGAVTAAGLDTVAPPLTITSGMLTAGIALHLLAIRRHRRPASSGGSAWLAAAVLLGIGVSFISSALPSLAARSVLLYVLLISMIGFLVANELWPERRFLGVRTMIATALFAIAANLGLLVTAFTSAGLPRQESAIGMLLGLLMPVLTTTSFMLWLQEELRESLQRMAQTDALTGAYNRHGLLPMLKLDFERARRHGRPMSVAVCDIDRFKAINDRLGHAGGDDVLRHFVQTLKAHVRASDLVGRWGGEEFLVMLPEANREDAAAVLERVRARPAGAPLDAQGRVTFSAGIASTAEPCDLETLDELIARADARLYLAKVTRDAVITTDDRTCTVPLDTPSSKTS